MRGEGGRGRGDETLESNEMMDLSMVIYTCAPEEVIHSETSPLPALPPGTAHYTVC